MTLHIALIEPKIPPNTGNIARLCVATDTPLHLIEPLGFSLDNREVKRAGLDYWERVDLWTHPNWFRFRDAISRDRCLYFSANAEQDYTEAPFRPNSVLVFGNETDGMPAKILEKHPELCYRIPMQGEMRSLNLANAVGIVLYEGLRQLGLKAPPRLTFADPPSAPDGAADDEEEDEINGNVEGAAERVGGRPVAPPAGTKRRPRGRGRGRGPAAGRTKPK
jgi:tRNA (cytidine/uridine-2'-O-)-methyltransferase